MRFFSTAGSLAKLAVFVLIFNLAAIAQVSLRTALDADGDDRADFYLFRPASGKWHVAHSGGGTSEQALGAANTDHMVPGDYDGDGRGDFAVWRATNGTWYRILSSNNTLVTTVFGKSGDEPVARDYDGDGKTDLAFVRRASGKMRWYITYSSTGVAASKEFGLSTDFVAPGDYNGDGKFDMAVHRPGATAAASGRFLIVAGRQKMDITFGRSGDIVVPGDYDGDGKTDIAVVREGSNRDSTLQWVIRRSSDGVVETRMWGVTSTDFTAQNDYDGDGRTDLVIWRNTNGKFYILNLANNSMTQVEWGEPSDMPVAVYDSH